MRIQRFRVYLGPLAVLVATSCLGCESSIGPGPSPPAPPPPPIAGTLLVSTFSATGWHANGEFHYRPTIHVTAGLDGSAVTVSSVRYEGSGDGDVPRSIRISYPNGRRVLPGATVDLSTSFLEIVASYRVHTLKVTVEFTDDGGRSGSATAESPAPDVTTEPAAAQLVIARFVVVGSVNGSTFWYWPKLTLTETTGRSAVRIVKMTFELLDVGPAGRVPPSLESIVVPPGGTIVLDEDPLGYGPWREISSSARAQRVSVVIEFVDVEGRGGSVMAIAEVS